MGNGQGKPVCFSDQGTWGSVCCADIGGGGPPSSSEATTIHLGWRPCRMHLLILRFLVNLNHFRLLRVVGKGAFGKVRIVERKDTALTFALKYIRKDEGEPFPSKIPFWCHRLTLPNCSCPIRECTQHITRATDAGAFELPVHLQSAVQFPRY